MAQSSRKGIKHTKGSGSTLGRKHIGALIQEFARMCDEMGFVIEHHVLVEYINAQNEKDGGNGAVAGGNFNPRL